MGGVGITYRSDIALQQRFLCLRKRRGELPLNCPDIVGHCLCQPLSLQLSNSVTANCSYMVRDQNTLKIYDVKSKDNH